MKENVKIFQRRNRIILDTGESVVVRCRNHNDHIGRRRFITLHPGDRLVVRCREFKNNNNNNNNNNHR